MAGSRQTRGYFIAGALFLLVLLIAIVKSDYIIQNTLSKTGALPVRAVKIDGVFRQITSSNELFNFSISSFPK